LALGYLAAGAAALAQEAPSEDNAPTGAGLFESTPAAEGVPAEPAAVEPPAAEQVPAAAEGVPAEAAAVEPTTAKQVPAASGPGAAAAAPEARSEISVEDGRITLHAKDEDLTKVLETLSRLNEVNIIASKSVKGKISADLYKVTVDEVLDAICRANDLRWVREKGFIYVYTPAELEAIQQNDSRLVTEVFQLNYLTSGEAVKLIQPILSKKATTAVNTASEVGIASGSVAVGGNSYPLQDCVVVRDFPENLEEVRKTLKKMDQRPRLVMVEATILQVQLTDTTSLGINFNTLEGVDFRDLAINTEPTTAPATITTAAAATPRATQHEWGQVYTQGFAAPGTGLNIGVVTNNVSIFINALEDVTDTTVLSNPKVLTLNKQRAEVMVGDRIGYRTTTFTETQAYETVEFLESGTQLVFRPFISDDGYIRMEVHPEVSNGDLVNNLPRESTTEVTCNVMIKDGHTLVIGGLFDENSSIGRTQVPGLGNIPGLGWLFRSREDSTTRNEIIVLLTPHIIQEEEAYALGEQIRDDADRRCMGLREGFGFLTRERLTVAYLQEADKSWRKYEQGGSWLGSWGSWLDREWAWWNVNLALNVAPNNLKAMRLKDKILSSKKGRPVRPAPWTLWDSIQEHMNPVDRTRGLVPEPKQEKPKAPEAKPEPPRGEAPAKPVAPPAADVAPKAQGEKR
jgi:type IV pilus assembly protein PilQ